MKKLHYVIFMLLISHYCRSVQQPVLPLPGTLQTYGAIPQPGNETHPREIVDGVVVQVLNPETNNPGLLLPARYSLYHDPDYQAREDRARQENRERVAMAQRRFNYKVVAGCLLAYAMTGFVVMVTLKALHKA